MKHSKKVLKALFGSQTDGLSYLQSLANNQKAPILFVSGEKANATADWLGKIHGNPTFIDVDELIDQSNSNPLLIIKNAADFTDPAVQAALAVRANGQNLIVASVNRPKAIAYINDSAFMSIYADDFKNDVLEEIADIREELS